MKDMVNALIRSKLVETPSASGRNVASSSNDNHSGTTNATADPWQRIFPPIRTAYGGRPPFNPWWRDWAGDEPLYPHERVDGPVVDVGMFDAEDRVYRCIDCMHEIWGGRCSQCDREYPSHPEAGDEDEDDDEEGDLMENGGDYSDDDLHGLSIGEMLERIEGGGGAIWPLGGDVDTEDEEEILSDEDGDVAWDLGAIFRGGGPLILDEEDDEDDEPVFAHISEAEEPQEEEEDGYESSFIDDSGEGSEW